MKVWNGFDFNFYFILTGLTGLSGIFRLRRGSFGRRPHYPKKILHAGAKL
jgi:hypothetical protein